MRSYFHVTVGIVGNKEPTYAYDFSAEELKGRVLDPRASGLPITLAGQTLGWDRIRAIKIVETGDPIAEVVKALNARRQQRNRQSGVVVVGKGYSKSDVAAGSGGRDVTDQHVFEPPGSREAEGAPEESTSGVPPGRDRKVMLVVGRERPINRAMENWLRSIGLEPLEWAKLKRQTGSASPFIGEVLERAFQVAQAVVVLMTPDDVVRLRDDLAAEDEEDERRWTAQPRPNVLFEAGMAFATHPKRTAIVEVGSLRGLSDLDGRHSIRLSGVKDLRNLAGVLEDAGCAVDDGGSDWLDFDEFAAAIPTERVRTALDALSGSGPQPRESGAAKPGRDAGMPVEPHPLSRLVREHFIAVGHPVADDVVEAIVYRLRETPDGHAVSFDDLPGRQPDSGALKRVQHELYKAHLLERIPGERGLRRGPRLRPRHEPRARGRRAGSSMCMPRMMPDGLDEWL